MKRVLFTLIAVAGLGAGPALAQTTPASATAPGPTVINRSGAPVDVDRIIRAFAQKETEFRNVLNEYSFKRDAVVQSVGHLGGQIQGEYRRVSRFVFDDSGTRYEKILHFPVPTIQLTTEDLEDMSTVQTFVLEPSKVGEYNFTYVGMEKVDELNTYVFDVTPRFMSDPARVRAVLKSKQVARYFQGRVWLEERDLQVVKARGKGVPEDKNHRYPTFETYREQVDGKYWFPTYTYADDELVFGNGNVERVRMRIKFTDYERLRGKATVVEEGKPGETEKKKDAKDQKPATPPTRP
ncbi:MAG TPA: hypothetical protein VK422_15830 [Pyrinomonadaceae bacterium]|nr:hypothetical protein [Pyrinomonadaceae bacterium]